MTATERFWANVDQSGACWLWTGSTVGGGRGQFMVDGVKIYVHRFAYELMVGPIPEGMTIDHVAARGCTSKLCVNPDHLEPVTRTENIQRWFRGVTHCKHDHEFTPENTMICQGRRRCRTCHNARKRKKDKL